MKPVANIAFQGLGAAINVLVAVAGIKMAEKMLEGIMAQMVAAQRGPTVGELDVVFNDINARQGRIDSA